MDIMNIQNVIICLNEKNYVLLILSDILIWKFKSELKINFLNKLDDYSFYIINEY